MQVLSNQNKWQQSCAFNSVINLFPIKKFLLWLCITIPYSFVTIMIIDTFLATTACFSHRRARHGAGWVTDPKIEKNWNFLGKQAKGLGKWSDTVSMIFNVWIKVALAFLCMRSFVDVLILKLEFAGFLKMTQFTYKKLIFIKYHTYILKYFDRVVFRAIMHSLSL